MKKKVFQKKKTPEATYGYSGIILHVLLLVSALGLALDLLWRSGRGASLCPTEACLIVEQYIRIQESSLIFLGLLFFLVFWLVYFFASRYDRPELWGLGTVLLFGALAFDGGLLGFQFGVIQEQCHLCIAVGAALILVLAFFALVREKGGLILIGLAVFLGGGAAGAMFTWPDTNAQASDPQIEQARVLEWSGEEAEDWPRFYFFFSLHCPHCSEILFYLAQEDEAPGKYQWNFVPLDTDTEDLKKIAALKEMDWADKNPFYQILLMEEADQVPEVEVSRDLRSRIGKARDYFQAQGFRGVPVTVVQEAPGEKTKLTGGQEILTYFVEEEIIMVQEESKLQ